jgi:DNA mismatch repair protein MutS
VAICDQLEDPKMTKSIVKRGVTELVTPGVSFNDQLLEQKKNNFLCALHIDKTEHGVAFLDVTTGEFLIAQGNKEYIEKLLQGFEPSEIVYQKRKSTEFSEWIGERYHTYKLEEWVFTEDYAKDTLNKQFQTKSLKGFGIEHLAKGIIAAGAAMHYLTENQHSKLGHISAISRIEEEKYVWLDRFTVRNLELISSPHENAVPLVDILDRTSTPMGGRLMKRWIVLPLKDSKSIERRLAIVDFFKSESTIRYELTERLKDIGDIERLISKAAVGKVNPKEVRQLMRNLHHIQPIKALFSDAAPVPLRELLNKLDNCEKLTELIASTLMDEPAIQVGKGPVIRDGVDKVLDDLRAVSTSGKDFLEDLQHRESERTGIPSLKVAFNNVFGYYLEVRNTHKDKVPDEWIRKQTLVNAERYITEELKEYETKILGAEEKIALLEAQHYNELVLKLASYVLPIQQNAFILAQLDCLVSFADVAQSFNYTRPTINDGLTINIELGRHPVIEQRLPVGQEYIANDVYLDTTDQQIIMITGPNMSGKSAILRQTALICLMAQMGSFVPAAKAEIGWVDKVFTRVGASDNISSGESTFMVEMNETASILNNLSDRSLILLDEIGRGTSTYDGISIAWSIAEYLHQHPKCKAKTLFATHYHELNEMAEKYERIKNYTVAVKEIGSQILFMRKLIPGGSEHSFGIHVAKLAGMPNQVVKRAEEMLTHLESQRSQENPRTKVKGKKSKENTMQLSFFQLNDPVLEQIHEELISIDINALTPVEALMKLNEIKKIIGG